MNIKIKQNDTHIVLQNILGIRNSIVEFGVGIELLTASNKQIEDLHAKVIKELDKTDKSKLSKDKKDGLDSELETFELRYTRADVEKLQTQSTNNAEIVKLELKVSAFNDLIKEYKDLYQETKVN